MKPLALALATTALSASAAFASADITSVDRNGDRFASFSEVTAVYPGLTRSDFRGIDTNGDNRISAVELAEGRAQSILHRHIAGQGGVRDLNVVDTDGDNFVSFTELADAYPGLSVSDWNDVDLNGDNRVSSNELFASTSQNVLSRHDASDRTVVSLSTLDTDGSGFASAVELAARYSGISALDFEQIDLNGDNRVSINELYDANARVVLSRAAN